MECVAGWVGGRLIGACDSYYDIREVVRANGACEYRLEVLQYLSPQPIFR